MDSLPRPFTITVDGQKVAPPVENGDDRIHAATGSDAAVFTLNDCHLQSNGWFLGRYQVEDRSLLPKRVYWFKAGQEDRIQPVFAVEEEGSIVLKFGGSPLVAIDALLFATLLGEPQQKVEINYQ
ncbi:hypothetical protein BHE90_000369 [Fusarium euwallaceae]|uniref:Uncharacterized protein n=4 Tax=Fusarium solani species complex TaxID=232080 RepID=A0A428T106_9HYPO|nr:hypothetical protein CEP51_004358 [Fusarium floridanum]RSL95735.1 hypothetical protein CEP52_011885 [Fusarium oligoseptatum]RSM12041.1 hypothetical protein CDV31_006491 [Fusarium ambrosium]RTE85026.1 hypothetical protein BHE90_000369 [Fusarium euwallaceae]